MILRGVFCVNKPGFLMPARKYVYLQPVSITCMLLCPFCRPFHHVKCCKEYLDNTRLVEYMRILVFY